MNKKEDEKNIKISKAITHKDNECILTGIDEDRQKQFNEGQTISISNDEFNVIGGNYRWILIKKED